MSKPALSRYPPVQAIRDYFMWSKDNALKLDRLFPQTLRLAHVKFHTKEMKTIEDMPVLAFISLFEVGPGKNYFFEERGGGKPICAFIMNSQL